MKFIITAAATGASKIQSLLNAEQEKCDISEWTA